MSVRGLHFRDLLLKGGGRGTQGLCETKEGMLNRSDLLHCLAGHQELPCIPSTASCLSVSRLDRIHRRSFDYAYKPWIPLLSLSLNRQDRPWRPPSRGWQVQSRGGDSLHLVRVQVYIEKSAEDVGPLEISVVFGRHSPLAWDPRAQHEWRRTGTRMIGLTGW